jgi:hypothetical protein
MRDACRGGLAYSAQVWRPPFGAECKGLPPPWALVSNDVYRTLKNNERGNALCDESSRP